MTLVRGVERRMVQRFYGDSDDAFAAPRPDPSKPPGSDLLPQIKHVVVLMMENHSFDNYLGTLGHGDGLRLSDDGSPEPVAQDDGPAQLFRDGRTAQVKGSPKPSWLASHLQFADGTNGGFRSSIREMLDDASDEQLAAPLRYWDERDLPFYAALARTFPLADRWFASCLGPTFPNRRFLISATADGLLDDLIFRLVGYPKAGTIFDLLTRNGIDWVNYHAASRSRLLGTRALGRGGHSMLRRVGGPVTRLLPGSLLQSGTRALQFTTDLYPLGLATALGHLRSQEDFFADAAAGRLPAVSIVDPDFTQCSEENPQDIALGEQFAARVIDAVLHGAGWPHTVLFWLYDEHGGYYDHVPPPAAVEPDDKRGQTMDGDPDLVQAAFRKLLPRKFHGTVQAECDTRYDRLGFRVPAVIVSPYARPGAVISDVFDHTSVLRFIEDKWNLPSLTRRDAAANSPITALDLDAPPAFATPPALPAPSLGLG